MNEWNLCVFVFLFCFHIWPRTAAHHIQHRDALHHRKISCSLYIDRNRINSIKTSFQLDSQLIFFFFLSFLFSLSFNWNCIAVETYHFTYVTFWCIFKWQHFLADCFQILLICIWNHHWNQRNAISPFAIFAFLC